MTAARPWQDALLAGVPMAARELPRARSVLAGLARFAAGQGIAASPEWLLDFDVVEAFCVRGCAGRASCHLRHLPVGAVSAGRVRCTACRGGGRRRSRAPRRRRRTQLAERAELAAVAAAQRDPARRASALAMVVFGIGAGLRPGELAALRGTGVARAGGQVIVHVTGGPAPRTVPVHRALRGPGAGAGPCGARASSCSVPVRRTAAIRTSSMSSPRGWPLTRPRRGCRRAGAGPASSATTWPPPPRCRCCWRSAGSPRPESLARYARHVPGMNASKAALRARWRCGARAMTGGLRLPPAGGISDEAVAFAAELIDRSGKAPVIEAALAHRTGRPRPLPVRAVLTALLCLALEDRPLFLTEATRLLFRRLSGTSRALLEVTGTASGRRGFLAAYRRVRYCFGAICSVMDPSALPKNRRLTAGDLAEPHQADDPRPDRRSPPPARSIPQLPARSQPVCPGPGRIRRLRRRHRPGRHPGARCSPAAPPSAPAYRPATPTAAGTSARATTATTKTTRASRCGKSPGRWKPPSPPPPGRPAPRPPPRTSPLGLAITRPGEDPGGTGARVLASVAARGHKTGPLGYDRAYTQALPARFHLPARALGYQPVMDYQDPASSASRQTPAEPSSSRAPGTARPCPRR